MVSPTGNPNAPVIVTTTVQAAVPIKSGQAVIASNTDAGTVTVGSVANVDLDDWNKVDAAVRAMLAQIPQIKQASDGLNTGIANASYT